MRRIVYDDSDNMIRRAVREAEESARAMAFERDEPQRRAVEREERKREVLREKRRKEREREKEITRQEQMRENKRLREASLARQKERERQVAERFHRVRTAKVRHEIEPEVKEQISLMRARLARIDAANAARTPPSSDEEFFTPNAPSDDESNQTMFRKILTGVTRTMGRGKRNKTRKNRTSHKHKRHKRKPKTRKHKRSHKRKTRKHKRH